jgi:hypothetical protein
MIKKAGIIGSGDVARSLAKGFLKYNCEVMMGTRETSKLNEWKNKSGVSVHVGSFTEAALFGDLIVLAVKGTAAKDALNLAGAANLSGRTIIDVTNPISEEEPVNGVLKFFTTLDNSLMEQLQDTYPGAHFVKAFNSIGNTLMVNPDFSEGKPTMFICGNNSESKKTVSEILYLFGFEIEDMGGAEAARAIEPLCMLWCIPGFLKNEWNHAFKLLK